MGWISSNRVVAVAAVAALAVSVIALLKPPAVTPVQVRELRQRITELKASNAQVRAEFDRAQARQSRDGVDAALQVLPREPGATPAFITRIEAASRDAMAADRLYAERKWAAAEQGYEKAANEIVTHCPARLVFACTVLLRAGVPLTFGASPFAHP